MANLCIIPARGGSKRIPKKNIKDFLGSPIISYSIKIALKSNLFDEVMVSTDDNEIAKLSKKYGAKVPFFRSEKASNDFATLADVVDEVKLFYSLQKKHFNYICCILPTSPLIQIDILLKAYKMILNENVDSVRPICKFSYPIHRALKFKNGYLEMYSPEYQNVRSQDIEESYHDAGQFYWIKWGKGLRGNKKMGIIIEEKFVQDIDSLSDWHLAEIKYRNLGK